MRNAVVLTGDVHSHWAAEVHKRADDPSSDRVATELVTTSISSGGDGSDTRVDISLALPKNPHIRYFNNRRGYVRTRITSEQLRADFRVVPFVSRPGAAVHTDASFVVSDGVAALQSAGRAKTGLLTAAGAGALLAQTTPSEADHGHIDRDELEAPVSDH